MQKVTADMKIPVVLELGQGIFSVFMRYGMHCLGCSASPDETIKQACEGHGIDVDQFVKELNEYLENK